INAVKAHDSGDNIKWGADMRTAYDNISYDMANGDTAKNDSLYSMRLWLNMAYAPDQNNVFKGQLSMNKAFGADFASPVNRTFSLGGQFDWTSNEALTDNSLKVRQAYWLYLGENAFGAEIPWTFSIGRRPSTNGFLASLSQDDAPNSPLGHMINVEYDGFSSKLDLSKVTGVPGMSIKLCVGKGSTNAQPLFETATPYADNDFSGVDEVSLAGFIIEPYNDGQIITKAMLYRAFNVPGQDVSPTFADTNGYTVPSQSDPLGATATNIFMTGGSFYNTGDMDGAVFSVLVDGLTEEGYFADVKAFGSFGWSESNPDAGNMMLGSADSESGTSYWFGAYLPVTVEDENYGTVGLEYNHGSEYWRPFTYAEDTMAGSKLATRGDAWEANYTYQINEALSMQLRYVSMDYEYTGSNGFFGNFSGATNKISDLKAGAAAWDSMSGSGDPTDLTTIATVAALPGMDMATAQAMAGAAQFLPNVVEAAEDFRFYLRYRF
ncbi:MAG: DUF3373 family protein, partial [Sulfurovum sp.]|uniref:DUF3373 family protein n=1 Tax=Sulfurovum sp. TaxID=1969726 RepID=UPI0028680642